MEKLVIQGGVKLKGKIRIGGAKNAAVAIIPAAILSDDVCTIDNLPDINDVKQLKRILENMNAMVHQDHYSKMVIDTRGIDSYEALGSTPEACGLPIIFRSNAGKIRKGCSVPSRWV